MKIMISNDGPHAHYYIRTGWARVFEAIGHQVAMWNIHDTSAFDAFDEFEPDIFLGQTYNLTPAIIKCIKERPHLKVIMRASDWGEIQKKVDKEKYPILIANDDEIKLVELLKQETGKPDFVHNHYHENFLKQTHNNWLNIGVKPVSILHAADVFEYVNGQHVPYLSSDITFVGGYWPYKSKTLDEYIVKLCHPVGEYYIKIFGGSDWPVVQYLGKIQGENVKHAFRSATVCPNVSEPHSQEFGYDIIERPFKILAAGGFCVSDYVESMANDVFTNQEIVFAKNPKEFKKLIDYYINHPEEREPYIQRGYHSIITQHTYFHRVAKMFEELGNTQESQRCLQTLESMVEDN